MRTTLTLDDDIFRELEDRVRSTGRTFKDVVNEALRSGLRLSPDLGAEPYEVSTFSSPFLPGVDQSKLNQLFDEMETTDDLAELNPPSAARRRKT